MFLKTAEKIIQKNAFEQKKKKLNPGLSANRPSNNWAQVVISHSSHVCSQHSFGLPLRMNGMYRTQFDHEHLDLVALVI